MISKSKIYFLIWLGCIACPKLLCAEFIQATPGRTFIFPRDHGSHPEFKTEWWYFTGHLDAKQARRFGFQWTVFRVGLVPPKSSGPQTSAWRAHELFFGHLAISDLENSQFYFGEAAARNALGMSGAATDQLDVWLPGFRLVANDSNLQVNAATGEISINLRAPWPGKIILHGDLGYSPKASEPGRASYYYSVPHLDVSGDLRIASEIFQVRGNAWMDHEFGSNQLAQGQSGWDWFGIPLPNSASLMIYRLRGTPGGSGDFLSGSYVDAQGKQHKLAQNDIRLQALEFWKSPSGGKYPIAWNIEVPHLSLSLKARAHFPEQELQTKRSTQVTYWEGSIAVTGTIASQAVQTQGYLEMTGYAESFKKDI